MATEAAPEPVALDVEASFNDVDAKLATLSDALEKLNEDFRQLNAIAVVNPKSGVGETKAGDRELVGGTFEVDEGVHKKLVNGLYDIVGDEGIGGAVDGSFESSVLHKIGSAAKALSGPLVGLSNSIQNKIKNILQLKNLIEESFTKVLDVVETSTDKNSVAQSNAIVIKEVHDALVKMFDQQLADLQRILQVSVKPTHEDLLQLLKDNADFSALANTLGVDYNTDNASDRLALAYTNMSQLQLIARQTEDALKTLKISLEKYKTLKSASSLKASLTSVLKDIQHNSQTTEELQKIIKAMNTLEKNQHRHGEIVRALTGAKEGGDYNTGIGRQQKSTQQSTLKRRLTTYESTVKELFKNFISQINADFKEIQKSVEAVSDSIGGEIAYDDNLKLFITIFEGFRGDLDNRKLFYALISLDQSVGGRELRTRFVDNLNRLIESLDVLSKHAYLNNIRERLVSVKDNIDTYTETVLGIRTSEENTKTGNAEFMWTDKLADPSLTAIAANMLKNTITKLKFFGNLSLFKDNLKRVHEEQVGYTTEYSKLLGKSIGEKVTELNKAYVEAVDRLNDKERGRGWLLETYNKGADAGDKIPRGLVETIYKLQHEAKVGLYKTVEAIDLYLMNFTTELSGNIEAVRDLTDMLKNTELISKWFDQASNDSIDAVMRMIRPDAKLIVGQIVAHKLNTQEYAGIDSFKTGKAIRDVLEASKHAIETVAALKNLISMFMHIGDKFGSKSLASDSYMSPGVMHKNLVKYIWVSAFTMGYGTAGGNKDAKIDAPKKDKNGYEIETGDKDSFFNLRMVSTVSPVHVLGELEAQTKTKISELRAAIVASAAAHNPNPDAPVAAFVVHDVSLRTAANFETAAAALTDEEYRDGVREDELQLLLTGEGAADRRIALANQLITVRPDAVAADNDYLNGLQLVALWAALDRFEESIKGEVFTVDDKYFVMAIKAIAAKILTVVDSSAMLRNPSSGRALLTNPVRVIVGAGESDVVDEAVELYIRLSLVVEFYKKVFDNGNEHYKKNRYENDDTETIAYIPEIGSKWSGLIQCIFDESRQISSGIYSLDNMHRIIREVNRIYQSYTDVPSEKLVRTVVLDLISEINRRYGVLKRKDVNEFYQIKNKYLSNKDDMSSTAVDYDILGEANEFEDTAPSSQFTDNLLGKQSVTTKTTTTDIQLVREFRDKIQTEFFANIDADLATHSFVERIKFYKNEISMAADNAKKVELVIKAIDESSNINVHNVDTKLMFHELIKYPTVMIQQQYRTVTMASSKLIRQIYRTLLSDGERDRPLFKLLSWFNVTVGLGVKYNALRNAGIVQAMLNDADLGRGTLIPAAVAVGITEEARSIVAAVEAVGAPPADADEAHMDIFMSYNCKLMAVLVKFAFAGLTPHAVVAAINEAVIAMADADFSGDSADTQRLRRNFVRDLFDIGLPAARIPRITRVGLVKFLLANVVDNEMVDLKFVSSSKFVVDYSKLQKTLETSIEHVKYMLSKFRNQLDVNMIRAMERNITELEDKFLFKLIYNQDTHLRPMYEVLNMEFINNAIAAITTSTEAADVGPEFYRLLLNNENYNAHRFDHVAANYSILADAMRTYNARERAWTRIDKTIAADGGDNERHARNPLLLDHIWNNPIGSDAAIVTKFNTLVARYLSVFYDSSSKKIYNGLFDTFCNKSQSSCVFGGDGLQDMIRYVDGGVGNGGVLIAEEVARVHAAYNAARVNANVAADEIVAANSPLYPKSSAVLAESIGFVLRTFINRSINKQLATKYHLQTTFSEVSPNMVEKYRAYLPFFVKEFKDLAEKATVFKKLLDMTAEAHVNGAVADAEADRWLSPEMLADEDQEIIQLHGRWVIGNTAAYSKLGALFNNLIEACNTIASDAMNVFKETETDPLFFDTKGDFIKNFFNNTKEIPLMPNSILSTLLTTQMSDITNTVPSQELDSKFTKFMYGSNPVLYLEPSSDVSKFVWLKKAIVSYNNGALAVNKLDVAKLTDYLKSTNALARSVRAHVVTNRIVFTPTAADYFLPVDMQNTYFSHPPRDVGSVISIVENASIDNSKLQVVSALEAVDAAPDYNRATARMLNLLELNVCPIDIHALHREIPGVNLYNYSFTFDNIVKSKLANVDLEHPEAVTTTAGALAQLMLDPYSAANVKREVFAGLEDPAPAVEHGTNLVSTYTLYKKALTEQIENEHIGKLGRPKYISDGIVAHCDDNEQLKFNNKLVRSILFVANVQRFVVAYIKKEVEHINKRVVSDMSILNKRIVEYERPADAFDNNEFEYLEIN